MEKWLLVLGARSDIARAVAHRFGKEGFNLYLAARKSETLEESAKDYEIRHEIKAETVEFDALDYSSHSEFYSQLDPPPEAVLCAVGYLGDQEEGQSNWPEASRILNTNYTGCVSILNVIAEDFSQKGRGTIMGITSVAGDRGRKSNYLYGSAKAGFSAYLSGLRHRLYEEGVHVVTIKPGFVATSMTEDMDLPGALTATPEQVAKDVYKAYRKKRDILYTRWFWKHIMRVIRFLPEFVFKRTDL